MPNSSVNFLLLTLAGSSSFHISAHVSSHTCEHRSCIAVAVIWTSVSGPAACSAIQNANILCFVAVYKPTDNRNLNVHEHFQLQSLKNQKIHSCNAVIQLLPLSYNYITYYSFLNCPYSPFPQ